MSAATVTNENKAETSRGRDHVHGHKAASDRSKSISRTENNIYEKRICRRETARRTLFIYLT